MVTIEKLGYGIGMVGNMIYMMQQLAPGRSSMTHYAFANSFMNLVLVPTAMISGPLADKLGFSTFFFVVMFASVPSIIAAWRAPFPIREGDTQSGHADDVQITVDDPTRLSESERNTQILAGRASIFAMLSILLFLVVDMNLISYLIEITTTKHDAWGFLTRFIDTITGGRGATGFFALLIASALTKVFFASKTFAISGETIRTGEANGALSYLGNARGAKIATIICGLASCGALWVGARLAF
jgi:PAT family beta-lactamase induction signal transducer AmpG